MQKFTATVKFDNNPLENAIQFNERLYEQMRYRSLYNQLLYKKWVFWPNRRWDFELESAKILFPNLFCAISSIDVAVYNEAKSENQSATFSLDDYLSNSEFLRRFW